MVEVHNMRTPPLPSPGEAKDSVAAHHPNRRSSQSTPTRLDSNDTGVLRTPDRSAIVEGSWWPVKAQNSSQLHEHDHTANQFSLPTFTGNEGIFSGEGHSEDHGRSLQIVNELRRQMEGILASQQALQGHQHSFQPPGPERLPRTDTRPTLPDEVAKRIHIPNTATPPVASSGTGALPSAADSTGSDVTVTGRGSISKAAGESVGQTPSYPFPRMQPQPQPVPDVAQDRTSHNTYFKLRFPAEKLKDRRPSSRVPDEWQSPAMKNPFSHSFFLPPDNKPVMEDPKYPSPNLYDLTLKLNADPGLDAWWSSLVDILQAHYGAERISLAVPGDSTDLENVPWGQKAIFNQSINDRGENLYPRKFREQVSVVGGSTLGSNGNPGKRREEVVEGPKTPGVGPATPSKRPSLLSRHSFAGFGNDGKYSTAIRDSPRLQHVTTAKRPQVPGDGESGSTPKSVAESRRNPSTHGESSSPLGSQRDVRQAVFTLPRPLEVETDPLIKRTGVVKLFGRTKPVVLTREYSQDQVAPFQSDGQELVQTPDDKVQITPSGESQAPELPSCISDSTRTRSVSNPSAPIYRPQFPMEVYEEYEQVPPSPWSQSPAPSPAPRAHADQNPFFATHAVDEAAFARNPPPHDYSKLEPLEAIGVDRSKSVVHIPLLHVRASKDTSPLTLRFPIAIISILSPIVPYPANLRQSLSYLMPHLTTSFCLAQQYTQLERQVNCRFEASRYGQLLGLGGTFSNENSELELVAGLSSQVSNGLTDDASQSPDIAFSSPGERSTSTRFSPSLTQLGTPGLSLNHPVPETSSNPNFSPGVSTKHGNDAVDSYFNVKRSKSLRESIGPHRSRLSKTKQNVVASTPSSPGSCSGKPSQECALQDPSLVMESPVRESNPAASAISLTHTSSRHTSTNSLYAQLHRELQRPFPDTIAQLMLNSIPLHLFLAKPQTGEVIWTNTKFDAYRRSQPQEQNSRNPWQNIHSSEHDHISQKWENALRTGSQFTERVRVMRFNDESAYRWFIFRANPLLSSTGEVLYWIGSFLDIHEQHVAELKAAQERERFAIDAKYRAFSNSIPQVVFEAAEYRGLIFANEQWNLYSGQPIEEALNLGFTKHVHPDDLEKCSLLAVPEAAFTDSLPARESGESTGENRKRKANSPERRLRRGVTPALDELLRRGVFSVQKDENGRVFYSTEIRLRSKGGDFRWHLVRVVRAETISFGNGEASWYGTCTDINDRKLLEKELNKAMQRLNKEMESKTKFFSNMSHEIRTPLNGILGTIPFILDTHLDTDQRRMLDTIQNSSTNLRELVDNILDVSRVEAGKMTLVSSWFHVRTVIEDVIDTIASRALDKGLEINYLMDSDVPAMVIGDRFRIRQVLINLVGNAVKFTSHGEIYTRCSIHRDSSIPLKPTEILLNFDVVDTGKGFSSGDSERLMQRFSQLGENSSQQHAGSGLGLFLSKQLVEMHGGMLTPSGKEGQGAVFSFYVKVDAPAPPTPEGSQLVRQASSASTSPGRLSRSVSYQRLHSSPRDLGGDASRRFEIRDGLTPEHERQLSHVLASSSPSVRSPDIPGYILPSSALQIPENQLLRLDHVRSAPDAPSHETSTPASDSTSRSMARHSTSGSPTYATFDASHQGPFSVLILAPLDHTREAIKQHIEQVVPHEVPFTITSLADVDEWKDSVNSNYYSDVTHLVINLPVEDVWDVMQYVSWCEPKNAPTLVIISDLYQKRQIQAKIMELASSGKRIYTVPKPLKPSAFSPIFDPCNRRDLSKDRNQDMAREINDNFKTVSKMVKSVVGNKGYRILLVEDDATNRMVCLSVRCFLFVLHANDDNRLC